MSPNHLTRAPGSAALFLVLLVACSEPGTDPAPPDDRAAAGPQNPALVSSGRQIFRFETFGNETFWTDTLDLHEEIQAGLSPNAALQVGLKVDVDALPADLKAQLAAGEVNLDDPNVTVTLIGHDAVVGVRGQLDGTTLTRVGITCALCHSTVDNSFSPLGIGRRLDGWPNRDLDVGAIVAFTQQIEQELTAEQIAVYQSWGPGRYDPRFNQDEENVPVILPPAFGLRHVARELYTGDDVVSYWNAYVAITQMHGHGTFVDPRIGVSVSNPPDLVSSKLDALRAYQFSLPAPDPQPGSYDVAAARRGRAIFNAQGRCASCHMGDVLTDINAGRLHDAEDVGQNEDYALRSVTQQYRTTPLRGLWNPPQLDGPYFHDGSATTLEEVVQHYDQLFELQLSAQQQSDLVEYLKSL